MTKPAWPGARSTHGGADEVPVPFGPGRLWLCGKRFVGPDPEWALAEVGAQVVVCLCERFELEERYPEYSQWLSAHAGGAARMFPVPDLHAPSVDEARAITGEVAGLLTSGRSVLMHCGAGMGRAGTMAAAVLMSAGVDLDDALHVVAASRPGAGPEAGAQMELLLALQTPEPGA